MKKPATDNADIAVLFSKVEGIENGVKDLNTKTDRIQDTLSNKYVTKEELDERLKKYDQVVTIVYSMISLIVLTVLGALLSLVIVRH